MKITTKIASLALLITVNMHGSEFGSELDSGKSMDVVCGDSPTTTIESTKSILLVPLLDLSKVTMDGVHDDSVVTTLEPLATTLAQSTLLLKSADSTTPLQDQFFNECVDRYNELYREEQAARLERPGIKNSAIRDALRAKSHLIEFVDERKNLLVPQVISENGQYKKVLPLTALCPDFIQVSQLLAQADGPDADFKDIAVLISSFCAQKNIKPVVKNMNIPGGFAMNSKAKNAKPLCPIPGPCVLYANCLQRYEDEHQNSGLVIPRDETGNLEREGLSEQMGRVFRKIVDNIPFLTNEGVDIVPQPNAENKFKLPALVKTTIYQKYIRALKDEQINNFIKTQIAPGAVTDEELLVLLNDAIAAFWKREEIGKAIDEVTNWFSAKNTNK